MAGTTVAVRFLGDISDLSRSIGDADSKLGALGKVAAGAFVGVGVAVGGAVVGLAKLGGSFDEQYDKIRVGTGKTGEALGGLEESFKNVLKSVPASFDDAGTAISDLNVRLGLTGKPLEDLAGQFINLSRITETDLATNVDSLTRVFGDWGVETKDQAGTLDKFLRTTQASGVELDALSQSVVQFGAPLRNLGFGLDESLALLAQFNKTGVNTETVFAGMKAGVGKLAKAGEDVPATFKRIVAEISKMGPGTEATGLAIKLFGQRAGPDLADAITGGKFELDAMLGAITGGKDTIDTAADDTADFAEQWALFKNRVLVGLEPLATGVFNAIGTAMDNLGPIVDTIQGGLAAMFSAFKKGDNDVTSVGFAGVMERIGNVARIVVDWFKENWPEIRKTIGDVFAWIEANVVPVVRDIVAEIITKVGEVVTWVQQNWPQISEAIGHVVETVKVIFTRLVDFIGPLWDNIRSVIDAAIRIIQGVISTVLAIINGDWGKAWEGIKSVLSGVWEGIKAVVGGAIDILKGIIGLGLELVAAIWRKAWEGIKEAGATVLRTFANIFLGIVGEILEAAAKAFGWVPGIGPKLRAASAEFAVFRDEVNAKLGGIKDKEVKVKLTVLGDVPGRPGEVFATLPGVVGPPTVIKRAHGGPVTAGRPYVVGDGGVPELFVPDVAGRILPSVPTGGGTTLVYSPNITVQGNVIAEHDLADTMIRRFQEWVRRNGTMGL